jgi:pre-rRNA-processing protein TSR1
MFGSCSTLVWSKDLEDTDREMTESLVMWGSVVGSGPNKPIIVKRATLTGYPFRVHKTKAVCRFMFFDPADIDWFRPVELSTKKGLRGHIIESLGTHGYMKCRFNGQLTSDDVICMHLYKRVFPKWTLTNLAD